MIFVRDKGRMCNNLLQYGHVYAWGREHHRATMSMRFAYKYQYFHICDTRYHHFLCYLIGKCGSKWGLIPTVSFDSEDADTASKEQQMLCHRHLLVEGWYVRFPELFLKYIDEIKQLFAFKDAIRQKVTTVLQSSEGHLRLGLHIRRGDYARWQGGRFLYSDDQYLSVVRKFLALLPSLPHTPGETCPADIPSSLVRSSSEGNPLTPAHSFPVDIFVCGNDPNLDRQRFREALSDYPSAKVFFPDGNPGEDLCLLSECNYLIGAPSTFTLVASMYHDLPLYWVMNPEEPLTPDSFRHFDYLFRHIL